MSAAKHIPGFPANHHYEQEQRMNHPLQQVIQERFGGVIRREKHEPDGEACLLEAANVAAGREWSDDPNGWPDLRAINDGPWESDEQRTEHLVPVLIAYWDWEDWSKDRQWATIERVVIETVRQIIAELPDLPDDVREQCRTASTLAEGETAARAASAATSAARAASAATKAAWAARDARAARAARAASAATRAAAGAAAEAARATRATSAARAASAATKAASTAASTAARAAGAAWAAASSPPLITACRIWIVAAEEGQ